jgi:hypothetical protein
VQLLNTNFRSVPQLFSKPVACLKSAVFSEIAVAFHFPVSVVSLALRMQQIPVDCLGTFMLQNDSGLSSTANYAQSVISFVLMLLCVELPSVGNFWHLLKDGGIIL